MSEKVNHYCDTLNHLEGLFNFFPLNIAFFNRRLINYVKLFEKKNYEKKAR